MHMYTPKESSFQSHALDLGDYIGMESCIDLKTDFDMEVCSQRCGGFAKRDRRWVVKREKKKKKEFPPPIPCLARTENLPSHMPWVLKRYYTSDGRLIIREEKVKHHEYFRAHRENGRLTLQLVPLDGDALDTHDDLIVGKREDHNVEAQHNEDDDYQCDGVVMDGGGGGGGDDNDVGSEEVMMKLTALSMESGAGKCLEYNSIVRSSSCMFGMPVPAIRPVHI